MLQKKDLRINARLDADLAEKFTYLTQVTGKNTSAIVREAIETYYSQVRHETANAEAVFEKHGFIGCAEAEADLSQNYKAYLESMGDKHDHR